MFKGVALSEPAGNKQNEIIDYYIDYISSFVWRTQICTYLLNS